MKKLFAIAIACLWFASFAHAIQFAPATNAGPAGAQGAVGPSVDVPWSQGLSLQTSATTAYFYVRGILASTTTASNAYEVYPETVTFTQIYCYFSAAQGVAKSDTITLVNITHDCSGAGAVSCTATNTTSCSATGKTCAVSAGDTVELSDLTVGASITARSVQCYLAP